MTGNVVDRFNTKSISSNVFNDSMQTIGSSQVLLDSSYSITIAATLGFTVGIVQVNLVFLI
jgi:hypothetical protein